MERRTLVQRQSDVRIADPDAFARLQVAELDKQARSLMQKRKDVQRQLEEDEQELRHVEAQIRMIHERYDPLCAHIEKQKAARAALQEALAMSMHAQQQIMGTAKETMRMRTQNQTKLERWMATSEFRAARRYETGRASTFKQSAPLSFTTKPTIPELASPTTLENSSNSSSRSGDGRNAHMGVSAVVGGSRQTTRQARNFSARAMKTM